MSLRVCGRQRHGASTIQRTTTSRAASRAVDSVFSVVSGQLQASADNTREKDKSNVLLIVRFMQSGDSYDYSEIYVISTSIFM